MNTSQRFLITTTFFFAGISVQATQPGQAQQALADSLVERHISQLEQDFRRLSVEDKTVVVQRYLQRLEVLKQQLQQNSDLTRVTFNFGGCPGLGMDRPQTPTSPFPHYPLDSFYYDCP